jgi:hypothetical protein
MLFHHKLLPSSSGRISQGTIKWPGHSLLAAYLAYILKLKMEAVCSSVTLVNFHQTTQHHIPEYSTLHSHLWELPQSNKLILIY